MISASQINCPKPIPALCTAECTHMLGAMHSIKRGIKAREDQSPAQGHTQKATAVKKKNGEHVAERIRSPPSYSVTSVIAIETEALLPSCRLSPLP